jgi:hypothetical protein
MAKQSETYMVSSPSRPDDLVNGGNGNSSTAVGATFADEHVRTAFVAAHNAMLARLEASLDQMFGRLEASLAQLESVWAARVPAYAPESPSLAWKVLGDADKSLNALTLGDPNHTVSHRAAHASLRGEAWGRALCGALDVFDPGHCADSLGAQPSLPNPVVYFATAASVGLGVGAGIGAFVGQPAVGAVIGAGFGVAWAAVVATASCLSFCSPGICRC